MAWTATRSAPTVEPPPALDRRAHQRDGGPERGPGLRGELQPNRRQHARLHLRQDATRCEEWASWGAVRRRRDGRVHGVLHEVHQRADLLVLPPRDPRLQARWVWVQAVRRRHGVGAAVPGDVPGVHLLGGRHHLHHGRRVAALGGDDQGNGLHILFLCSCSSLTATPRVWAL